MAYTTINKSTAHFNTKLYTGNGGTQSITGVGFQPDLTWIKQTTGSTNNVLYDAVRGAYWTIQSNTSAAQSADDGLVAWNSDGFNLGNVATTNASGGSKYASWNWKAGTTGSGTTGQGKTYNYSVNATAGFSIIKYQGSGVNNHKIPHHLGAKPMVKFVKSTGHIENWTCYWDAFQDSSKYIQLNTTTAKQSDTGKWGGYDTSSLMNLGSDDDTNEASSGVNFVAYCFAEKQGYSKFGSYKGNGNADGAFVYTGFKPAFVMIKRSDGSASWEIRDNKRKPFPDGNGKRLFPDSGSAESSNSEVIEKLSNGFKIRSTGAGHNANNGTYIYMAFGQSIVGSNNVPATAR